jgi:flagellar biosynthesis/type III secretory pathway protein FliH
MSDNAIKFSKRMSFVSPSGASNVMVTDNASGDNEPRAATPSKEDKINASIEAAFQQGWKTCEQEMNQRIQELNRKLDAALNTLPASLDAYFSELEKQVKTEIQELSFKIARIILGGEIKDESRMRGVVEHMLEPVTDLDGVKLFLCPEFVPSGNPVDGAPEPVPIAPSGIEIVPDSRLKPGEAVLETSQGIVDGTLDGRLEKLKEEFDKFMEKAGSDNNV